MDDRNGDEGFLSRWSRRKTARRDGLELPAEPLPAAATPAPRAASQPPAAGAAPSAATSGTAALPATAAEERPSAHPAPTLEDVAALTKDSDFSAFARPDVDPAVRNAAMKKLFHAEPQFNVMDGLDVYIDDYNTPQPLPRAIMRQMLQARAMGLLDDELKDQDLPDGALPPVEARARPGPSPSIDTAPRDEDPDLQLQPNDAAAPGSPGNGAGEDASRPAGPVDGRPGRGDA